MTGTKVGKIGRAFGPGGEVLVSLYDTFPDDMDIEEPLYVRLDGLAVPLFIEHFERRGRGGAQVRFADVDNVERAALLVGEELFLPGGGERDLDDIVGWKVVAGDLQGVVTEYFDSDMNPLLQVEIAGREALIPVAFVGKTDRSRRRIILDLPEGLLELND